MRLRETVVRKFKAAARFLRHFGVAGLFWETLDYVAQPLVRAVEDAAWRRIQGSADGNLSVNVQGHRMFLLRDDVGISKELALYKVHEPLTTRVLSQILTSGMCVADVGSNIGYFLLIEARLVGPTGLVIGFEPEPANFQMLKRNVQINGYDNVVLRNEAIGERRGMAALSVAYQSNWHSLSAVPWETRAEIPVKVATLDQALEEQKVGRVDLVRMDIEGYELRALEGMRNTLDRIRPRVLMEIHPHIIDPPHLEELFEKLRAARYDVEYVLERRWDHRLHAWRLQPERLSITQLARDPRVVVERRTITAVFRPC